MSLWWLLLLYVLAGLVCGAFIYRRSARSPADAGQALLALPLWPLWAPVALTAERPPPIEDTTAVARIERALREGVQLAAGSPLAALLSAGAAEGIVRQAQRAQARLSELSTLLGRPDLDLKRARARVSELEPGPAGRALAAARLHLDNVERLQALADHDRQVLAELGDLAEALRTQLLLARYAGSSAEGIGGIVSELWARVEGLGEAMDVGDEQRVATLPAYPGR